MIRFPRLLSLIALGIALGSCRIGFNSSMSSVARSPFGAMVEFQLSGTAEEGPDLSTPVELLTINDAGLIVEADGYLVLVRFQSFRTAKLQDSPGVGTIHGDDPDRATLREAQHYSRYPFGLEQRQLASLLEERGQPSMIVK
jgi:hypothetical protein